MRDEIHPQHPWFYTVNNINPCLLNYLKTFLLFHQSSIVSTRVPLTCKMTSKYYYQTINIPFFIHLLSCRPTDACFIFQIHREAALIIIFPESGCNKRRPDRFRKDSQELLRQQRLDNTTGWSGHIHGRYLFCRLWAYPQHAFQCCFANYF